MILNFPEQWRKRIYKEKYDPNKELCKECDGRGEETYTFPVILTKICTKCDGEGTVYWTENILKRKNNNYINSFFHLNQIKIQKKNIEILLNIVDSMCRAFGFELQVNIVPFSDNYTIRKSGL